MFGTRAYELIKDLDRTKLGTLPAFDENGLRQVLNEMHNLHDLNHRDLTLRFNDSEAQFQRSAQSQQDTDTTHIMKLRHLGVQRNKQCVLSYLYNRLIKVRDCRWNHGSVLPESFRLNTTEPEQQFFRNYNKILANYMKCIGNQSGIDLTQHMKPPRSIKCQVKVLQDWEIEDDETGEHIYLKKDSIHYLDASQSDLLVRQSVLQKLRNK